MTSVPSDTDYPNKATKRAFTIAFSIACVNREISLDLDKLTEVTDAEWQRRLNSTDPLEQLVFRERVARGERTRADQQPDPRYKNVRSLTRQCLEPKLPVEQQENVIDELYPLILELMQAGKIKGDFKLEPYRDAQIEQLRVVIRNLEERLAIIEETPIISGNRP